MKRALIVLAIVLVAAGFIRGWFALSGPQREPESKKVDVNLTVDPEKIQEDAAQLQEKAVEFEDKVKEELRDLKRKPDPAEQPARPAPEGE
jgi:hypothetical protein